MAEDQTVNKVDEGEEYLMAEACAYIGVRLNDFTLDVRNMSSAAGVLGEALDIDVDSTGYYAGAAHLLSQQLEWFEEKMRELSERASEAARESESYKKLGKTFKQVVRLWSKVTPDYQKHIIALLEKEATEPETSGKPAKKQSIMMETRLDNDMTQQQVADAVNKEAEGNDDPEDKGGV